MNYNNTLIIHFEGMAIFINETNDVFYVVDENEVLDIGSSIESDALTSIDELGKEKVAKILSLIDTL